MQIIDEKGKILGKINIIDLTLIIFTILVLITGYKYLYLKNYPENVLDKLTGPKNYWVNVTTINYATTYIFNQIKRGDVMMNLDLLMNEPIGRIVSILDKEVIGNKIKFKVVYSILVEKHPNELLYEQQTSYSEDIPSNARMFTKKRILLGQNLTFDTETYSLSGEIIKIER